MKYDITQPWKTLDKWQKEYIETSPEQDCFLLTGRQVGKTAAMAIKCVEMCVHHFKKEQNILICSITEKQAYRMLAKALIYAKIKYPNKVILRGKDKPTKHIIRFTSGSGIYSYAAGETGEGLRGDTIKKLMIDEGSRMSEEFFLATTPMLSVSHGSMDIASTPKGKTYKDGSETFFYKSSKDKHYKRFYVSAEVCPRHTKEFLAREKERMTKLQYAQEYLARFLEDVKQVFSEEWIAKVCLGKRRPVILQGRTYFYGADVARKDIDKFTHEIIDRTDRDMLVHVESITTTNIPLTESARRIIALDKQYDFRKEYIDSGGMGIAVCDILREDDDNKRKVVEINNASRIYETDSSGRDIVERKKKLLKEELYENMINLGEQGKLILLDDEDVKLSLRSLQYEITQNKIIYFGNDSHIVEGLIRACWCVKDKSLNIWFEWM